MKQTRTNVGQINSIAVRRPGPLVKRHLLSGTAALNVDIGGTATTDFGRFTAASRTANLSGTLNINIVNAFAPALSDTFQIMTFASRNGTFGTENGTTIGGGLSFDVNYGATEVSLEVVNQVRPL